MSVGRSGPSSGALLALVVGLAATGATLPEPAAASVKAAGPTGVGPAAMASANAAAATSAPAAADPEGLLVTTRDDAARAAARPRVAVALDRLARLEQAGDTAGIVAAWRAVEKQSMSTLERELLAERTALALAGGPPDAAGRELIAELKRRPAVVYVRLADAGHQLRAPLYDPAAQARLTERRWAVEAVAARAGRRLAAGGVLDLADYRGHADDARLDAGAAAGLAAALERAPAHALPAQREMLGEALAAGEPVAAALLVIARRLADPESSALLIEYGDNRAALAALVASAALDPPRRYALLETAAAREDIASAALLAMAPLTESLAAASQALLARLGDPSLGASAALALARSRDPSIRGRLAGIAADDTRPLAATRAGLALEWMDDPVMRVERRR